MVYDNFISVRAPAFIQGNNWELQNLNHLTVLFGKNGSGKSVLLRLIRDIDQETNHYIIPERTGGLNFEPSYMAEEIEASKRKKSSASNFTGNYRQRVVSRIQSYFNTRGATRGDQLPGNPEDLEDLLKFLLPDFEITLNAGNPPYKLERLSDNMPVTQIDQISSGEAQMLTLSIDILTISAIWDIQKKAKRILLIDEPDPHLHPDLQVRFADFLTQVGSKFNIQIIVATHSTTLLSALGQFGKSNCSTIFLNKIAKRYTAQPFNKYLQELSACLGGHALMGPLFGAPLLLVEGDDDYRIWSQVPRHSEVNIAVIATNGDEISHYQKTLEKLFGSISEPRIYGHTLIDGDKGLPQPSEQNPQDYMPYIQMNCHECENLYLTDEVLTDLGITWEQAIERINQQAENFGNKQARLIEITTEDRRNSDLKTVINELNKILDTKNVHWTTRIGNRLGKERPMGQLLDFLGEGVVNAIWN